MDLSYLLSNIVSNIIDVGIEPIITKDGLVIMGFYKSGQVILSPCGDGNKFNASARYGENTLIESFDDLVELNYDWWQRSKSRSGCWTQPEYPWAEQMVRLGLVEKKTIPAYEVYE